MSHRSGFAVRRCRHRRRLPSNLRMNRLTKRGFAYSTPDDRVTSVPTKAPHPILRATGHSAALRRNPGSSRLIAGSPASRRTRLTKRRAARSNKNVKLLAPVVGRRLRFAAALKALRDANRALSPRIVFTCSSSERGQNSLIPSSTATSVMGMGASRRGSWSGGRGAARQMLAHRRISTISSPQAAAEGSEDLISARSAHRRTTRLSR
jgi:hypothetical protein